MIKKVFLSLDVTIVFVTLTIWLSENNVLADGFLRYGIPFNFYTYSEAKSDDPTFYSNQGFYPRYFIMDMLVLFILIAIANYIAFRLLNKVNKT